MTPFDIAWSLLKQSPQVAKGVVTYLSGQNSACPKCGQRGLVKYDDSYICTMCGYNSARESAEQANQHPLQTNPFWVGNSGQVM